MSSSYSAAKPKQVLRPSPRAVPKIVCQNQTIRLHSNDKAQRMNREAPKSHFPSVRLALACILSILAASTHGQSLALKTETFNTDPAWEGRNNRATDPSPRTIVQNFGFSSTANAGGPAGEIGGFITPAGEVPVCP